jgi:VanZ family protein
MPKRPWAFAECLMRQFSLGHEVRMFRIFAVTAAWLSLLFIAFATLSPIHERPDFADISLLHRLADLVHYIAFAVVGGLFGLAYPRQTLMVCVIVFGSAILLELMQMLTPDRHARFSDALEKMTGGAIGLVVERIILSRYFRGYIVENGR